MGSIQMNHTTPNKFRQSALHIHGSASMNSTNLRFKKKITSVLNTYRHFSLSLFLKHYSIEVIYLVFNIISSLEVIESIREDCVDYMQIQNFT
jgi:hypothetical protein